MIQKKENPFKGKVAIAAKNEIERKKQEQGKKFAELYQAKKDYVFPSPEEINLAKHFYFPKILQPESLSLKALACFNPYLLSATTS